MRVRISPRGLVARVRLEEGERPDFTRLQQLLQESGIIHGVDPQALEALSMVRDRPITLVVARGTPPQRGADATVEYGFGNTGRSVRWSVETRVEVRDLLTASIVEKGQFVARKQPATVGRQGVTVLGTEIPGRPGRDVRLKAGRNCEVSRDGMAVRAAVAGQPTKEGDLIGIQPMLHVPGHVDRITGDIDFEGDVLVSGDITPGCTVKASGNIFVKGQIRGGQVRAGGHVNARCIRQHADIRAEAGILARSAEHSYLRAKGNIRIVEDLLFCEVDTDGTVDVGGRIVGGTVLADEAVRATAIGSRQGTRTRVLLHPVWRRKREEADRLAEFSKAKATLDTVSRSIEASAAALGGNRCQTATERRLASIKDQLANEVRERLRAVLLARRRAVECPAPRVVVLLGIFSGAELQINNGSFVARSQQPAGQFVERNGAIVAAVA